MRLEDLAALEEHPQPALAALIPVRSRLPLLLPDLPALWLPDPRVHYAGGYAWHELPLSHQEALIWRTINGSRTVQQVAASAGLSTDAVLTFLARLTLPEIQAVQLRKQPLIRRDPSLERVLSPERLPNSRAANPYGASGETTLEEWHQRITDGTHHFDDRETTIAHAFGEPHPGLGGQRFGERLYEVLEERGLPVDRPMIELGPGDGELAEAWLSRSRLPHGLYTRVDIAPALLATQRARLPETREVLASATSLPFPDRSVGMVICNEVIADLSAVPYEADQPLDGPAFAVEARLRRYRLPPLEGRALYNLGAWMLIEELARVLKPGGGAYLSEFGTLDEAPQETEQLDHPEVSIHFGYLQRVGRALGLDVQCVPMAELLRFDLRAQQLSRHSYEGLRARFHKEQRRLSARAYTPETLHLPWRVEGLQWVPLTDLGPGPLVTRFYALLLRKPGTLSP